jgi:two-component system, cell cycle response regulator DivK
MSTKGRVLLVEDNESTIDVVEMELKCLGYEVTTAKDGLEGLKLIGELASDIVIMDIQLPKMDGFEVVRQIRANPAIQNVPILAATAKALKGDREKCLEVGCDGYIAKPFNHRELDSAINEVFKRRLAVLDGEAKSEKQATLA